MPFKVSTEKYSPEIIAPLEDQNSNIILEILYNSLNLN